MSTRIGLVGAGFTGGRHADSLAAQDGVAVVGIAEPQRERARATADRLATRIQETGLLTSVGYHWRYLDTVDAARELLAGAPARMVLATWLDKAPRMDRWARQDRSGGQTVERPPTCSTSPGCWSAR
ncbi:hypothetical protein QOZ88_04230 [Blastococcus sp. BMG 814]|uniref:Oxidoreductase family, NAD-binding Rossmann fold n=1 Tax=Blastococcus carthaginiensis TaxID=3050034 RepID=A0ABT9I8F0_9ACTN|nr:hypothetical protein [Blastococcus carthaginiensis]MDP5181834.1 hypothetical protein [Blastococcus carthaginiensis]